MWYILLGILVISIIVIVHEFGHFGFAKLFGIPVDVFCLGYGKPIIKKKIGGTVYGVGPIPFGGYVKIPGLDPREKEMLPPEEAEKFFLYPYWKRVLMVTGGPVANTILAFLVYVVIFMVGVPGVTTTIDSVEAKSPAAKAGIKAGDKIVAINGASVTTWQRAVEKLQGAKGDTVKVTVVRDGKKITLTSGFGTKDGARYIGIVAKRTTYNIGMGFFPAVQAAFIWVATLFYEIFRSLVLLLMGRLPFRPMSPVGIVQVTSQAAQHGYIIFLNFVAFINVAIGATNLIPIFPLDGARALLWTVERVIRRQLSNRAVYAYQFTGVGLLLLATIWALYLDIFKAIPDPFK
ncbi:MAG: M50 family metallopeptidase [Actinomycetota bacterium]